MHMSITLMLLAARLVLLMSYQLLCHIVNRTYQQGSALTHSRLRLSEDHSTQAHQSDSAADWTAEGRCAGHLHAATA